MCVDIDSLSELDLETLKRNHCVLICKVNVLGREKEISKRKKKKKKKDVLLITSRLEMLN